MSKLCRGVPSGFSGANIRFRVKKLSWVTSYRILVKMRKILCRVTIHRQVKM